MNFKIVRSGMTTLLVAGLVFFSSFSARSAAASSLIGLESIQNDLLSDAANGFRNLTSREWQLIYDSTECVNIALEPAGSFELERLGTTANIFKTRLVSTENLLTPFGEVVQIKATVLGCGAGSVQPTDEVGVEFRTNAGVPIVINNLSSDRNVTGLALAAIPAEAAVQTRLNGSILMYRRNPGYGLTPVKVTLTFNYNGVPYRYEADLPVKDDGLEWVNGEVTVARLLIPGVKLKGYENFDTAKEFKFVDSESEAERKYEDYLRRKLVAYCERRIEKDWGTSTSACNRAIEARGIETGKFRITLASAPSCYLEEYPDTSGACSFYESLRESTCFFRRMLESDMGSTGSTEGTCYYQVLRPRQN